MPFDEGRWVVPVCDIFGGRPAPKLLMTILATALFMVAFGGYVFGSQMDFRAFCSSPFGGLVFVALTAIAYRLLKKRSLRCWLLSGLFSFLYSSALIIGVNSCNLGGAQLGRLETWAAIAGLVPYVVIVTSFFLDTFGGRKGCEHSLPSMGCGKGDRVFAQVKQYGLMQRAIAAYKKRPFLYTWLILVVAYIPYVLLCWPSGWGYDASGQVKILIDDGPISAWHPVLHTLLLAAPLKVSHWLTGHYCYGAAAYTVFQVLTVTAIYAYISCLIRQWRVPRFVLVLVVVFFCVQPGLAASSVTGAKDVLFSACFGLCVSLVADLLVTRDSSRKKMALLWASMLIAMLLRNNAVYGFALALVLILLVLRSRRVYVLFFAGSCIAVSLFVTGPCYSAMGVTPTYASEALSVPLAQMSRAYHNEGARFTEEQRLKVEHYVPYWDLYDPFLADTAKWDFPQEEFKSDPSLFFKAYLDIGMRYPEEYTDAFLQMNVLFYAPAIISNVDVMQRADLQYTMDQDSSGGCERVDYESKRILMGRHSLLPTPLVDLYNKMVEQRWLQALPGFSFLLQIGTWLWLAVFYVFLCFYSRQRRLLVPAILFFGYWCTVLLGPGVVGRYALVALTCAPAFFSLLFVVGKERP